MSRIEPTSENAAERLRGDSDLSMARDLIVDLESRSLLGPDLTSTEVALISRALRQFINDNAERCVSRRLIDSCNFLCEYVGSHLPRLWTIRLDMSRDECSMELIDPFRKEQRIEPPDYGFSTVSEMCDVAIELDKEIHNDASDS